MRSLPYLSIFTIFLLTSCTPVKKSQLSACPKGSYTAPLWSSPFLKGYEKALFHTTMDVKGNYLSGITIIKKTSDSSFHFTFANEIGITYFDLEIMKDNYHSVYIFEPMNKPAFLKIFFHDLKLLLFSDSGCGIPDKYIQKMSEKEVFSYPGVNLFVWIDRESGKVSELVGWTNMFDAAHIEFERNQEAFPSLIKLSNSKIKLNLELSLLGR